MIEEAIRLEAYLPMSWRTTKERYYVRFLWEASAATEACSDASCTIWIVVSG